MLLLWPRRPLVGNLPEESNRQVRVCMDRTNILLTDAFKWFYLAPASRVNCVVSLPADQVPVGDMNDRPGRAPRDNRRQHGRTGPRSRKYPYEQLSSACNHIHVVHEPKESENLEDLPKEVKEDAQDSIPEDSSMKSLLGLCGELPS